MKKIVIISAFAAFLFINACNNSNDKGGDNTSKVETSKTPADSLMEDVMNGHDVGMAKMGKLSAMQNKMQQVIDSIEKLPAKTKKALAPYEEDANKILRDLKAAKEGMENWMDEFNMDSAINNMEERMKYLRNEKLKVSNVKENILNSLQRADSLIKQKF